MLSRQAEIATHRQHQLDWHAGDDLILRARRERALWVRRMAREGMARLVRSPLGRLFQGWSRRRGRHAELKELLALDERTLRDIGLRRDDLLAVVSGETTLDRLNAERLGGARGALVELRSRARRRAQAQAELDRAA